MQQHSVDLAGGQYAPSVNNLVFSPSGFSAAVSVGTGGSATIAVVAGTVIRFSNANDAVIGVAFGTDVSLGSLTAVQAMDLLPGSAESFAVPVGADKMKFITPAGTYTVKYTVGVGA